MPRASRCASSSSGLGPRSRHFSTTTGVCSSPLPCGLSSRAAFDAAAARTPREAPRTLALSRSLTSTTAHAAPVRARSGLRERVRLARRQHDRAFVRRHRSGVPVDRGERFAHHFVERAAPAERAADDVSERRVEHLRRVRRGRSRAASTPADSPSPARPPGAQSAYASADGRTCSAATNSPCAIATAVSETAITSPGRAMPRHGLRARSPPGRRPGARARVRTGIADDAGRDLRRASTGERSAWRRSPRNSVERSSSSRYFREPLSSTTSPARALLAQPARGIVVRSDVHDRAAARPSRRAPRASSSAYSPPTSSTPARRGRMRADALVQRHRLLTQLRHAGEHGDARAAPLPFAERIQRGDHAARVRVVRVVDHAPSARHLDTTRSVLGGKPQRGNRDQRSRASSTPSSSAPAIAAARFARLCAPGNAHVDRAVESCARRRPSDEPVARATR